MHNCKKITAAPAIESMVNGIEIEFFTLILYPMTYAMIVLPAVITTGRVVQTSSLSLSSPRMKTEIRRQLKFSISSAELELF